MGFYIDEDSKGRRLPNRDKDKALIADGAQVVDGKEWQPNLICVMKGLQFDAAGFCYDREEYARFAAPREDDNRVRVWLTHPMAAQLSMQRAIDRGYALQEKDGQWRLS